MFAESVVEGEPGSACWYLSFLWHKLIELLGRSSEGTGFLLYDSIIFAFFSPQEEKRCLFVVQFSA